MDGDGTGYHLSRRVEGGANAYFAVGYQFQHWVDGTFTARPRGDCRDGLPPDPNGTKIRGIWENFGVCREFDSACLPHPVGSRIRGVDSARRPHPSGPAFAVSSRSTRLSRSVRLSRPCRAWPVLNRFPGAPLVPRFTPGWYISGLRPSPECA